MHVPIDEHWYVCAQQLTPIQLEKCMWNSEIAGGIDVVYNFGFIIIISLFFYLWRYTSYGFTSRLYMFPMHGSIFVLIYYSRDLDLGCKISSDRCSIHHALRRESKCFSFSFRKKNQKQDLQFICIYIYIYIYSCTHAFSFLLPDSVLLIFY